MRHFDDESGPIKCECKDCGKVFDKGTEEDNETLCLRCEREAFLLNDQEEDYE